jgi:FlaA1/EpsC-like NDP-sugar epimerase
MSKKLNQIFYTARLYKKPLSIAIDAFLLILSLFFAYLIRLGSIEALSSRYVEQIILLGLIIVPFKIFLFWVFRLYHISYRYISLAEGLSVIKASAISSLTMALLVLIFHDVGIFSGFPRSVLFSDFLLTIVFAISFRTFFRVYYFGPSRKKRKDILVVGAGSAGEQLIRDMVRSGQSRYLPVGIIDDDLQKKNTFIHGIRVLGDRKDIPKLVKDFNVKEIIIAIPSATSKEIAGIMEFVRKTKIKAVKVLPGLSSIINGKVTQMDIRNISIEDLLGREPVEIDAEKVSSYITNKNILITGAGGSIGSELCRQIIRLSPAKLFMLDMGETELFKIDLEIKERYPFSYVKSIVGDIRDEKRVNEICKEHNFNTVFHAAAYKHVPLMEENPREAVFNNIYGTKVLAKASAESGVDRFIFVSTDKAVNPSSVMGATKRIAENLIRGLNNSRTAFISVRFGNVLGSRGSAVPIFQKQIEKGGPVTITDYEMKRYFMTISESVQLVMQAGSMGKGGDVFVLDMGKPVSIYKMAEELIRLSGLEPDRDIPIVISGKRPGEKLFEELLTAEEGSTATLHKKIYYAKVKEDIDKNYLDSVDKLISLSRDDNNDSRLFDLLKELVPSYQNNLD